ncbi:MAG: thiol-disulfide oxidoreductase DCC family protein [SAR324 cluster bacterium]|nr:thiol-disulfide oxidoreductase DCC family protein [SAR324 cluster bacterium]
MVIIFDGVCNLCEGLVIFIIKLDKGAKFKFVQAQSAAGKNLQVQLGIDVITSQTFVLVKNETALFKSEAALEIARNLDGAWKLLYLLKILPTFLSDRIYDYVAKNRFRWFGMKAACMMPTAALKDRFLD